ncbi:MAG: glycosyltransferase family 2 protein [Oscillospiraceae bacterium]
MDASVCILLATYNNALHVGDLLDSLLSQTCGGFVLLVHDDCSSDGTREIVEARRDPRIIFKQNERPSGGAQNNFFGLLRDCPDVDYIMFSDADDFWLPDKIERTLARMRLLEAERGRLTPLLVHGDLIVTDGSLNVIAPSLFRYERLSPERRELRQMLAQNNVTGCTVMINRALRALVPEQPKNSVMHDWWLALCASAFGEISVIKEPLICYRQHGDNEVGAYNADDLRTSALRLADSQRSSRIYNSMFAQAGCFADVFEDRLSEKDLSLCRAYAALADRSKFEKIVSVIRHGFYKNTLLRNIGQFLAI